MEIFQEVARLTFGEASSRRLQSAQTLRFTDSAMKCFVRVSLCMCTCMYYGALFSLVAMRHIFDCH